MGVAIPINPGTHKIVASASQHADGVFNVTLAEGARAEIEVQPGPPTASSATAAPAPAPATAPIVAESPAATGAPTSTQRLLAYGALGLGVVGLGVGIGTGLAASSKHGTLEDECPNNRCLPSAQGDLDSFHSLRTVSTIGYIVGAVGVVGAGVLWLTAPKSAPSGAALLPYVGPGSAGVAGRF
jgi:hypothetical protein